MDREVRWYFRWSRIMFWWLTVMAVIATTCTVYSFSGPTSQRSLMASLESSSQFRPEPSESGSAVNSLLDKQQSSTIAPRSARVSEIPETSPALQSRESHNGQRSLIQLYLLYAHTYFSCSVGQARLDPL